MKLLMHALWTLLILIMVGFIVLIIYALCVYGDKPIDEIPLWILWLLWEK